MQLRIGDRLTDARGDWEIISRPRSTAGGKTVNARVHKPGGSENPEERAWSAYEKVTVRRVGRERPPSR
jgi:hypothetical protein